MQAKVMRAVAEALLMMFAYSCAEYLLRGRPIMSDVVGLLLVGGSYLGLSITALVLGGAWRR